MTDQLPEKIRKRVKIAKYSILPMIILGWIGSTFFMIRSGWTINLREALLALIIISILVTPVALLGLYIGTYSYRKMAKKYNKSENG